MLALTKISLEGPVHRIYCLEFDTDKWSECFCSSVTFLSIAVLGFRHGD